MTKKSKMDGNRVFRNFDELLRLSYQRTPCQSYPMKCKPREIKHVVWDADDTIWDIAPYGIATYCSPPYKKINDETLESDCYRLTTRKENDQVKITKERTHSTIRLKPSLVSTLNELESKGIGSSISSANQPGSVDGILNAFGIKDKFSVIESNWDPKPRQVQRIILKTGVPGEKMMFIDDMAHNAIDVNEIHDTLSLVMGNDIMSPKEILSFIKEE